MFSLERAIADWRSQMTAEGIKNPELLDELESHLRADIHQQIRSGLTAQRAFDSAVQRIGQATTLKAEFKKIGSTAPQKLMGFVCVILTAFIIWMSGFTFRQMQLSRGEQMLAYTAVIATLLVACAWRHAVPLLPVIPNQRKRIAVGGACIVAGFVISNLLSQFVLPHFEHFDGLDRQIPAIGFWLVFPIALFTCLGLGLMMSPREREHWGMVRRQQLVAEQST